MLYTKDTRHIDQKRESRRFDSCLQTIETLDSYVEIVILHTLGDRGVLKGQSGFELVPSFIIHSFIQIHCQVCKTYSVQLL